jgi:hypothetical protein
MQRPVVRLSRPLARCRAFLNRAPWWIAYAILSVTVGPWVAGAYIAYLRWVLKTFGVEFPAVNP